MPFEQLLSVLPLAQGEDSTLCLLGLCHPLLPPTVANGVMPLSLFRGAAQTSNTNDFQRTTRWPEQGSAVHVSGRLRN